MSEITIPDVTTSRRRTRTYDAYRDNTQQAITALLDLICPAGTYIPTALTEAPEGGAWKLCDGQALSKSEYPRLYGVFGGQFGEDATTFNLPDLRGRSVMGASNEVSLGALAGQSSVTLTVDQMPPHAHAVTDPGHTHVFTGTPHSHTVTDPGHTHYVDEGGATSTAAGVDEVTVQVGGTSGSSTTGITVDETIAGGSNSQSQAGITIGETGGGQPVDITPPVIGVNWLVRA